ncbi:NAD-dependent epimerase/dehydratase family protein [Robbsia andropogonis]|uniref:NAD-dependent epimerase/dehydratase family protein n=1 Tax=Robbsia andropogonis TaxID=28092 RepID=UPI0020A00A2A|nr:NAD-dependent epimerase/dehydratase family protein [Robbsia andropogonis]MCP1118252.1 NAD-dependent epimerase/dehydratase family protein [Robbsia andropogonis]MCP1127467.1 NAD-dependent epimerase/dehydratase family protein [Robbsia andropogonis]
MSDYPQRVAVTGGSGFIACHLIQQLLSRGFHVNTTVRNLFSTGKVKPLQILQKRYPGMLKLFESDLLKHGSFDAALKDCAVLHHVASPFLLPEKITDGQRQLIDPALLGTRNVLQTVNRTTSIRRVVLTSTIGAIFGDYIDVMKMTNQTLSEKYFNTSSSVENNPYHYSKVLAEQEAWKIHGAQSHWSMVVINPGMVLGPSLTPNSESGSLFLLDEMLRGYFFYGVPDLSLGSVDVREVAAAHINAATNENVSGRYILAEKKMISLLEIAHILRETHHRPIVLPRNQIPHVLVKLIGPFFGLSQQYIRNHVGIRFAIDNTRSIRDLGIVYRPIEETLTDHYYSWRTQRMSSSN